MNPRLLRPRTRAGDPYFASVRLLLHFNGTAVDSSRYGVTFSSVPGSFTGTARFGTAAYSVDDGEGLASSAQSIPDISTGDYTVEAWVYRPSASDLYANVVCLSAAESLDSFTGGFNLYIDQDGTVNANNGLAGSLSGGTVPVGVWRHVAAVMSGGTSTLYVNGLSVATDSQPPEPGPYFVAVGYVPTAGFASDLVVDELRITVGVARYVAAFTPPTAEFPSR
jgi:hypothetical protein